MMRTSLWRPDPRWLLVRLLRASRALPPGISLPVEDVLRGVRGEVSIYLGDELVHRGHNLYVNSGYARQASFNAGLAPAAPGYLAVGNGNGTVAGTAVTPAAGDTTLNFELLRQALTSQSVQTTYTSRLTAVFTATQVPRNLTEVGLFDTAGDNGTATGAGQTTTKLVDTSKTWTVNQWANWTLYVTNAADGDAVKKVTITSNDATSLTLTSALTTAPVAGTSTYTIGGVGTSQFLFAKASITVNKGSNPMNVVWQIVQSSA